MFYQYIPTNEQNSGFTHDILLNSDTSIIILNIKYALLNTGQCCDSWRFKIMKNDLTSILEIIYFWKLIHLWIDVKASSPKMHLTWPLLKPGGDLTVTWHGDGLEYCWLLHTTNYTKISPCKRHAFKPAYNLAGYLKSCSGILGITIPWRIVVKVELHDLCYWYVLNKYFWILCFP